MDEELRPRQHKVHRVEDRADDWLRIAGGQRSADEWHRSSQTESRQRAVSVCDALCGVSHDRQRRQGWTRSAWRHECARSRVADEDYYGVRQVDRGEGSDRDGVVQEV